MTEDPSRNSGPPVEDVETDIDFKICGPRSSMDFTDHSIGDGKISSIKIAEYMDIGHDGEEIYVTQVGSLGSADNCSLAFCVYDDDSYIQSTNAGAVICLPELSKVEGVTQLRSSNPRLKFAQVVNMFFTEWPENTIIHPTATVADDAEIGNKCIVGPNVYIAPGVTIGDSCKIQAGTSIGGEGFGFSGGEDGELYGQVHKGGVVIGDQVEIGSNCSIDRAVFDSTIIGSGTKMDNLIHIAHNVDIGEDVWIADTAAIQGSVTIGDRVRIHPNSSIANHVTVERDAEIAMNAGVLNDVPANHTVAGTPAKAIE